MGAWEGVDGLQDRKWPDGCHCISSPPPSPRPSCSYCFHTSVLFPTWHRPMVYHFERVLRKAAASIAASYVNATERAAYTRVAEEFRLPYFDWANPYLAQ